MKRLLLILLTTGLCWAGPARAARYGVARSAAPVLNSPTFGAVFGGQDGGSLKSDRCGQVREMEFIALPGTVFRILGEVKGSRASVYRVTTEGYPTPAGGALYVDGRFLELRDEEPPPRVRRLPGREAIIASLKGAVGSPYVWGGNLQNGVPELERMFYRGIAEPARGRVILAGLDCSGLLYQATDGWTPRNTAQLVAFGEPLAIEGKGVEEIALSLRPLDLIVWNGHVIIVLDRDTVVESRLECGRPGNGGVMTTSLVRRLREIMGTRRPLDAWPAKGKQGRAFVIRRWFGP